MKKPVRVEAAGENPSLTGEFLGEIHKVLEQNYPPKNQHHMDPVCLWVAEEVTERLQRAEEGALTPPGPLPHIERHNEAKWVALHWQIPKVPPLIHHICTETKENTLRK